MTVFRTVQIPGDQLPKFEKMMEENGFEIVQNEDPEIPMEVQEEMERRARNWNSDTAIPADELLAKLKAKW